MWVIITKASLDTYWYSTMVGERYRVELDNDGDYMVLEGDVWPDDEDISGQCSIDCSDCVGVDERGSVYSGHNMRFKFIQ